MKKQGSITLGLGITIRGQVCGSQPIRFWQAICKVAETMVVYIRLVISICSLTAIRDQ